MTLTPGLEGLDGLALAADSRGTIGDPRGLTAVNDVQRKLFKLNDRCGIATSGSSEIAARLIDLVRPQIDAAADADSVIQVMEQFCRKQYKDWFGQRAWVSPSPLVDQRPVVVFLVAGYADASITADKIPRIYLLTNQLDFVPQPSQSGYMAAGVPQYATYLNHRLYNRNMILESVTALAVYLISETATQDPKVGGPIRVAQIRPDGGYAELDDATIMGIVKANEIQSQKLKSFFFGQGAER